MNEDTETYKTFKDYFKKLESANAFKIKNHNGQPYVRFKIQDNDYVIILKNSEELQLFVNKVITTKLKTNQLPYEEQRWLEENFILPIENKIDASFHTNVNLKSILKKIYGYDKFRDNQEEIMHSIMSGKDTVVLKPTGAGKSLCFQLPAIAMDGVAIVISPLISLMQNQVMGLKQLGVKAEYLNSSLSKDDQERIKKRIKEIKLLYISPEAFNVPNFQQWLKTINISFFAIDEAHCISRWGHDFRPDYTKLQAIKEVFKKPIIALTATADLRTRVDIPVQLRMKDYNLYLSNFDRPNIKILVEEKDDYKKQLLHHLKQFKGESGVIYCLSRKSVDETAKFLKQKGYNAYPYHAGLTQEERSESQQAFMMQENVIVVATIAFGMGIDKPNVRFVIHVNMPQNLESYYQEIGRAGRDGEPSIAILMYDMKDFNQRRLMILKNSPDQKIAELGKLQEMLAFADTLSCKRNYLLKYFGDKPVFCNNCSSCLSVSSQRENVTDIANLVISTVKATNQIYGMAHISLILKGSEAKNITEEQKLLPEYGLVSESESMIKKTIRQLIVLGYLKIDLDSGFSSVKIVKEELDEMVYIKKETENTTEADESVKEDKIFNDSENDSLIDQLRAKRLQVSQEKRIPPYTIFSDKSLKEMARKKPKNKKALKAIYGWGDIRIEQYGEIFINLILKYKDKK